MELPAELEGLLDLECAKSAVIRVLVTYAVGERGGSIIVVDDEISVVVWRIPLIPELDAPALTVAARVRPGKPRPPRVEPVETETLYAWDLVLVGP